MIKEICMRHLVLLLMLLFSLARLNASVFALDGVLTWEITEPRCTFKLDGSLKNNTPGSSGTIKLVLPDAHTDFIFAVVGEEYGAVACLGLVALFAYIALRAMGRIMDDPDAFTRLAVMGLSVLFGSQALMPVSWLSSWQR